MLRDSTVAAVVRTRPRAISLSMITMRKSIHGFLFPIWLWGSAWRPFKLPELRYEKSDWSRAFNQFTIACELDLINAISAADIAFIMSSSTSAWLLSPLKCSPQKHSG